MDARARALTFLTFLMSCLAICLLSASLLTHNWLVAKVRMVRDSAVDSVFNVESEDDNSTSEKFQGTVQFGLFYGKKILNYGYGPRATGFSMKELMRADPDLMIYHLYLLSVSGIALGLFFTVVASVLSVVNSVMTPVEKFNGAVGLYTWNSLSAICCVISLISWILQFQWRLSHNVMSPDERRQQWNSAGLATIGYSFLLVVLGVLLNLCNIFVVVVADKKPWLKPRTVPVHPKAGQGAVIMLY